MSVNNYSVLKIRVVAVVEILVFLCVVTFLSYLFSDGTRFINVSPNPFWIILLLVTVQYDLQESILCVIFMTIFIYAWNVPSYQFDQTYFAYLSGLFILPSEWLITSIVLSLIKMKRVKRRTHLNEEIENLNSRISKLTDSFSLIEDKNLKLEMKLATENTTAIKIDNAVQMLAKISPYNFLEIFKEVVISVFSPEKFSIFMLNETGLELSASNNWLETDSYKKIFISNTDIYKKIISEKKLLCVNSPDDQKILSNEGVLASALYDKSTGEVCGMLKFEKFRFLGLVNKNIKIFDLLSQWIGKSYIQMKKLEKTEKLSISSSTNTLYSSFYLQKQTFYLSKLAERLKFPLTRISVDLINKHLFDDAELDELSNILGKIIKTYFRATDEIFENKIEELSFVILIPGTSENDAIIVIKKLKDVISKNQDSILSRAKLTFNTEGLIK